MKLLCTQGEELIVKNFHGSDIPEYAILSHTWLKDHEEITYDKLGQDNPRTKKGWAKVDGARRRARIDRLSYIWIDTLCIDKSSSTELAEAINSMFRYYEEAKICYIYLNDMPDPLLVANDTQVDVAVASVADSTTTTVQTRVEMPDQSRRSVDQRRSRSVVSPTGAEAIQLRPLQQVNNVRFVKFTRGASVKKMDLEALGRCRWFTRGWTLQELLAPRRYQIFSQNWCKIPSSGAVLKEISDITRIDLEALTRARSLYAYSAAQRISWAARRQTTRVEDRAYSLFGILQVNLAVLYGEGNDAFRRLQEEVLRRSQDRSIFFFDLPVYGTAVEPEGNGKLLADTPDQFEQSSHVVQLPSRLWSSLKLTEGGISFESAQCAERGTTNLYLACGDTRCPTTCISLRITSVMENSKHHQVAIGTKRWALHDCWTTSVMLTKYSCTTAYSHENIGGDPNQYLGLAQSSKTVMCREYVTDDESCGRITMHGTSRTWEWDPTSQIFSTSVEEAYDPDESTMDLSIMVDGKPGPVLQIRSQRTKWPVRIFDLQFRFIRQGRRLRWHTFGDSLPSGSGRLFVRGFGRWRTSDQLAIQAIEIQYRKGCTALPAHGDVLLAATFVLLWSTLLCLRELITPILLGVFGIVAWELHRIALPPFNPSIAIGVTAISIAVYDISVKRRAKRLFFTHWEAVYIPRWHLTALHCMGIFAGLMSIMAGTIISRLNARHQERQ